MKKHTKKTATAGFTLLEMLVVMAIIAGLAALIIPMVGGASDKAAPAGDIANQGGLTKQILCFAEMNASEYPDTWDSLLDSADNTKIYGQDASSKGSLYAPLTDMQGKGWLVEPFNMHNPGPPGPGLAAWHSLGQKGITEIVDHDITEENATGSADGITPRTLTWSNASYVAILNRTNAGSGTNNGEFANSYVQAIYEHYGLEIDPNEDLDTADSDRVAVFGVGRKSTLVGNINGGIQDVPTTTSFDTGEYYGRYLALVKLSGSMGKPCEFLGVVSPRSAELIGDVVDRYKGK